MFWFFPYLFLDIHHLCDIEALAGFWLCIYCVYSCIGTFVHTWLYAHTVALCVWTQVLIYDIHMQTAVLILKRARGNDLKLREGRFILDRKKGVFAVRMVKHWHGLSREVVGAPCQSGWMELSANWYSWRCPGSLQWGWTRWSLTVLSNPHATYMHSLTYASLEIRNTSFPAWLSYVNNLQNKSQLIMVQKFSPGDSPTTARLCHTLIKCCSWAHFTSITANQGWDFLSQ